MKVFENQTANGFSQITKSNGGSYQIQIAGTFDGASILTQVAQENLPYHTQSNGTKIEESTYSIGLKAGSSLRFQLINAGASTDLTVSVI